MAQKAKVDFDGDILALLPADMPKMSGADIEAVLVRAKLRAVADRAREGHGRGPARHVVADFVPPSYPLEIELQNLVAVANAPAGAAARVYRPKPRDDVTRRIRELKMLLEER